MGLALVKIHTRLVTGFLLMFTLRVLTQLTLEFCKFNAHRKRKIGAF